MKNLGDTIAGALENAAVGTGLPGVQESDFLRDGLLHCGVCGVPKQCRINLMGRTATVRCMCRCENEAYQQERRRSQELDRMMNAQRLRAQGIQDEGVREYTFANAQESKTIAACRRYVERWDDMFDHNQGLLFWGDVGTGKTYAAACIANALIDRGIPALVTSFPKILNAGWDKSEIVKQMGQFPLLVLDDLGVERESDYALELVQMVVDERYKAAKPLIVTTNLTKTDFEHPKNMKFKRVYDRVLEMCAPVRFTGESRRKSKAEEKMRFAREVFGDVRGND